MFKALAMLKPDFFFLNRQVPKEVGALKHKGCVVGFCIPLVEIKYDLLRKGQHGALDSNIILQFSLAKTKNRKPKPKPPYHSNP